VLAYFLFEQFCGFLQHWFSWFLIFMCFSSPSSLLRAFLALLGFYSSIWFFCNLRKNISIFFFPYILYSSCIFFPEFCRCLGQFVFVCFFSLFLALFLIRCAILFYFKNILIPISNGWHLWTIFWENLSLISTWKSCGQLTFFFIQQS